MQKAHEILKKLRKKYGYAQKDVAKWINISRPSYTKKEKGEQALYADEFLIIIFNLSKLGPKRDRKISTDPIFIEIIKTFFPK